MKIYEIKLWRDEEDAEVFIEAPNFDEARKIVEREYPGWEIYYVETHKVPLIRYE